MQRLQRCTVADKHCIPWIDGERLTQRLGTVFGRSRSDSDMALNPRRNTFDSRDFDKLASLSVGLGRAL